MTKSLQSTQVSIMLALNVVSTGDTNRFSIVPLVTLTGLFFALWQLNGWLTSAFVGWQMFALDLAGVVTTGGKLLAVGLNALAWGVL